MHLRYSSFFLCLLLPLAFSTTNLTKPGCGDLDIPYPFGLGLGSNCSIGPDFDIHCNTSTNRPKAYISTTSLEVVQISESQIRVKYPTLALACYDLTDYQRGIDVTDARSFDINLSSTQYTLSDDNWMTAVGCEDFASVLGQTMGSGNFGGGCVVFCSDYSGNGFCPATDSGYSPGNGCCQTRIPRGTYSLSASLQDLHVNWRKSKYFPCSFAFVGERGNGSGSGFSYNESALVNTTTFLNANPAVTNMPLVLDWRVGTENCSQSLNAAGFACRENSICIDAMDGSVPGYRCACPTGFQGNPYLGPCLDIDKCSNSPSPCHPAAICGNIPGSFNCSCPEGYYGDATLHGVG